MKRYAFGAALVSLLVAGGIGWAAIPGSDSAVINGCYEEGKGDLRIVAAGEACKKKELAIRWNRVGPKGEAGPQGVAGTPGAKGDKGEPGAQGERGATGAPGIPGEKGEKGDPGPAGVQGEKGNKGDAGERGPEGARGPEGVPGRDGADGAPGGPSVAAKGWIRFLVGEAYLNWGRGVASVSVDAATGEFHVVYATPSPCGAGSIPVPILGFRLGGAGVHLSTTNESENGFTAVAHTTGSGPVTDTTDQFDFTFVAAC